MIKIENFCKPNSTKLIGKKETFDDYIDGELLSRPICGRIPNAMVRFDNMPGEPEGYFSAISCFAGGGCSHAYVSVSGNQEYIDVLKKAISEWNNGNIDYYERLDNVFRSCYSCTYFNRETGCKDGVCTKNIDTKPFRGCKDNYSRMSHDEFVGKLTR